MWHRYLININTRLALMESMQIDIGVMWNRYGINIHVYGVDVGLM